MKEAQDLFQNKRRLYSLKVTIIVFLLVILSFVISLNSGTFQLSPLDVANTLMGEGTEQQGLVLFKLRLPRMVIAVLVGAGLAVSGAILQGISRNDLSDPGILGINAGAGLAVLLYVALVGSPSQQSIFLMPFLALVGAGCTALLIYLLSYKKSRGIAPTRLLLVGIAVAAGISAITIILTLKLDPRNLEFVVTWQMGDLWGSNWTFVLALLPWLVILLPYVYFKSQTLNLLNLHEHTASSLGVRIEKERLVLLGAAVGLAAASVAIGGGIGFIGLLGPHIARRMVGPQHQGMLPLTACVGALIVLTSDTIARTVMENTEIPVGVVISMLGAPYFLFLLMRTR
ncbi:iron ABC transporter permease [Bacillaceae bacterium SIJ1]|uniref:FecCD family ABC transporter permease n=1 Tax=Litoribacterium kuwaitense TaxID=1398745 RepID=UPI0013E9A8A4|nr:iron ABC transporter permease [Litoribacterium kuwaitense]NGP45308.1 iron ABC transporter permease [Litoribacterium kuwaitense]